MAHRTLHAVALLVLALLAAGCPTTTPTPDSGPVSLACQQDSDCPGAHLFTCNTTTGVCEASCHASDDCKPSTRGAYAIALCDGATGCRCEESHCVKALCSSDSECGAQVCRDSACVPPPEPSTVAKCQVVPDLVVLTPGATRAFWVSTWTASDQPVVVKAGVWSAPSGSPLTLATSANALTASFTASSATSGTAPVSAVSVTVGSATCTAKAVVVSPPAAGLGLVYIDELTGRPIANADVLVSDSAGAVVMQGGAATVKTDARGFAAVTGPSTGAATVTAFHPDFSYVTVANYAGAGAGKDFLLLSARRNSNDTYGGMAGTFTDVPQTSNVHLGLTGMSLPGSITNLAITELFGVRVKTRVTLGSLDRDVPLPSGAFLTVTGTSFKDTVAAFGLAGTCVDAAGAPDETAIAAGLCGTRSVWGFTFDAPLANLPLEQLAGGFSQTDLLTVLTSMMPLLSTLNSTVTRDVQFQSKRTPYDGATFTYNFTDTSHFVMRDQPFVATPATRALPLSYTFAAKVPTLPTVNGAPAGVVGILSGANALGRGVVPLGLGIGVNASPVDTHSDAQSGLAPDVVMVHTAPTHHGLEGSEYAMGVTALAQASPTDPTIGLAATATFPRLPNNTLPYDPAGATPIDLSVEPFLPVPQGARFNFSDTARGTLPGRSFTFVTPPDMSRAEVLRVTFIDFAEHRWEVYSAAGAGAHFTLPVPPAGIVDRTFGVPSRTSRAAMQVRLLRVTTDASVPGAADVSFNQLMEFNDVNADRLSNLMTAFSFMPYGRPAITFIAPGPTTTSVAKGSTLSLKVLNFALGTTAADDGQLRVRFATQAGAPIAGCDEQLLDHATSGKPAGVVDVTLPMACAGANVVISAELVTAGAAPTSIFPAVSSAATVSIQ